METGNLNTALLIANLMMNVNRGFEELAPQIVDTDYEFLEERDTDDFYDVLIEFDFLYEAFCTIEKKLKLDHNVDMLMVDKIANELDMIRHYIDDINKPF